MTKIARPLYGEPDPVYGRVYGTLSINSHAQVALLQRVLADGMKTWAGRHEETLLAKLYNDLAQMSRRAEREGWRGWTAARKAETPKGENDGA